MEKVRQFFKEYRDELLYKVQWPKFEELQENTVLVLVASLLIALVIFVMDFAFKQGLSFVYDLFS